MLCALVEVIVDGVYRDDPAAAGAIYETRTSPVLSATAIKRSLFPSHHER